MIAHADEPLEQRETIRRTPAGRRVATDRRSATLDRRNRGAGCAVEPAQHPPSAPQRASGRRAAERRRAGRSRVRSGPRARRGEAQTQGVADSDGPIPGGAGRGATQTRPADHAQTDRQTPGCPQARRAAGAPPGIRVRGDDRDGATGAAAERQRAGDLNGGARRRARTNWPLRRRTRSAGCPHAAMYTPRTPNLRGPGRGGRGIHCGTSRSIRGGESASSGP
jgi:hypothetical protein